MNSTTNEGMDASHANTPSGTPLTINRRRHPGNRVSFVERVGVNSNRVSTLHCQVENLGGNRETIRREELNEVVSIVRTICIWNLNLHTVVDVHALLRRAVSHTLLVDALIRVRRICQKSNKQIRFEVDVRQGSFQELFEVLERKSLRFQWRVRKKALGIAGERAEEQSRLCRRPDETPLNLCTWNSNGITKKREGLEEFLDSHQIDIIALQETRRKADHWRLHLEGYNVVERCEQSRLSGSRGMAIAVKKDINAFPVGNSSENFQCIRVFGCHVAVPFLVGNVYLPHRHAPDHVKVREDVRKEVIRLHAQYPSDAFIVMGDFNRSGDGMQRLVNRTPPFCLPRLEGDTRTCRKGNVGLAIDHLIITEAHQSLLTNLHVEQSMELSDHYPVMGSFYIRRRVFDDEGFQLVRETWKRSNNADFGGFSMIHDNYWASLFEDLGPEEDLINEAIGLPKADRMVEIFRKACKKVGKKYKLVQTKKKLRKHPTSSAHHKACLERRRLYCVYKVSKNSGGDGIREFEAYRTHRRISDELNKTARINRWTTTVVEKVGMKIIDPKSMWQWIFHTAAWKRRASSDTLQPMIDKTGVLQTENSEIQKVWFEHFSSLANDPSGHSQEPEYWVRNFPVVGERKPEIEGLNGDITYKELRDALGKMKNNKAPGPDSIPVEFFKVFAWQIDKEDPDENSNALQSLLNLIQELWQSGIVPESLNLAVVVSILKKGDPTDAGNYRGISLMDALLKVLLTVITTRLTRGCELGGILYKGQAGFRHDEECTAQALALYEVVKRRMNVGLLTFACFLDFQKAYDTVPHQGLFRKLELLGIRGRMLNFIVGLYRDSKVTVRSNDGSLGRVFPLLRGLRQGDPMSPILFNLFINDLFVDCEGDGATIPVKQGLRGKRDKFLATIIPGLLFADDAAALADSAEDLSRILGKVVHWSEVNEMSFGVDKCGLMVFNKDPLDSDKEVYLNNADLFSIHGESIPIVNHYIYLGLKFTEDLSLGKMATDRLNKGRKAIYSLEPFFRCTTIPAHTKLLVLKMVPMQTILYGSEIWGMKLTRANAAQVAINRALRWILNFRGPLSLISTGILLKELDVLPISVEMNRRRARAYCKFRNMRTHIRDLVREPLRSTQKNWTTTTEMWLNRFIKAQVGSSAPEGGETFTEDPESAKIRVTEATLNHYFTKAGKSAPEFAIWSEAQYQLITGDSRSCVPAFGPGVLLVSLLRANAYTSGFKLGKCKIPIARNWARKCSFCGAGEPETVSHILLSCSKWNSERTKFIADLIQSALALTDDRTSVCKLILGGQVAGERVPEFYPVNVGSKEERSSATFNVDRQQDADEQNYTVPVFARCGLYKLAGFIYSVDIRRRKVFKENSTNQDPDRSESLRSLTDRQGTSVQG